MSRLHPCCTHRDLQRSSGGSPGVSRSFQGSPSGEKESEGSVSVVICHVSRFEDMLCGLAYSVCARLFSFSAYRKNRALRACSLAFIFTSFLLINNLDEFGSTPSETYISGRQFGVIPIAFYSLAGKAFVDLSNGKGIWYLRD